MTKNSKRIRVKEKGFETDIFFVSLSRAHTHTHTHTLSLSLSFSGVLKAYPKNYLFSIFENLRFNVIICFFNIFFSDVAFVNKLFFKYWSSQINDKRGVIPSLKIV